MDNNTDTIGEKIRTERERQGLTQGELARSVGTFQQTIDKIERGIVKHSKYLDAIRERLGIAFGTSARYTDPAGKGQGVQLVGERDLPVYGSAEGGGGAVVLTTDPIDFVRRPAPLAQVKDGYAVIASGDSMEPAYEAGDLVLVHPHLPPVNNVDVVLGGEIDGEDRVMIKRLMRFTATDWHLRQWNPAAGKSRDFKLSRKIWPKCHRVVGKYSRR